MMVDVDIQVRLAVSTDQRQIANLIHFSPYVHRHLDWRYPLDWIGSPFFYVLENKGQIIAALACPPDPPHIAWIRLFVSSGKILIQDSWQMLWDAIRHDLAHESQIMIAAIVLQEWCHELLMASGFASNQSIVMLERDGQSSVDLTQPNGFFIRPMLQSDLPAVADADAAAFDPLWQNSLMALEHAYPQAIFPTVAEANGEVIGYQLSTRNPVGIHLARLAVQPAMQGRGVGRGLVANLIQQIWRHGISHLTVNTQSDNAASLALYNRIGFRETGERYPVYQFQNQ